MASLKDFSIKNPSVVTDERPHHPYEAQHYARTRFVFYPGDFVELENPLEREVSAIVHLGPTQSHKIQDSDLQALRKHMTEADDLQEGTNLTDRDRETLREHMAKQACKITFAPAQKLLIPRELVAALVTVRDEVVVGGLLPMLRLVGDPTPPEVSPELSEGGEAAPLAMPTVRRSLRQPSKSGPSELKTPVGEDFSLTPAEGSEAVP